MLEGGVGLENGGQWWAFRSHCLAAPIGIHIRRPRLDSVDHRQHGAVAGISPAKQESGVLLRSGPSQNSATSPFTPQRHCPLAFSCSVVCCMRRLPSFKAPSSFNWVIISSWLNGSKELKYVTGRRIAFLAPNLIELDNRLQTRGHGCFLQLHHLLHLGMRVSRQMR